MRSVSPAFPWRLLCGLAWCLASAGLLAAPDAAAQSQAAQAQAASAGVRYAGGDGSSIKKAVVIEGVGDEASGVAAEHAWIAAHLPGAKVQSSGRITGPPHYDVLTVVLADGKRMDVHFDITAFHRG